jgi:hypothetical protein
VRADSKLHEVEQVLIFNEGEWMTAKDVYGLVRLSLRTISKHLGSDDLEALLEAQGYTLERADVGKGRRPRYRAKRGVRTSTPTC